MRIAIASGKGGTGKTLISTCLTALWADEGHGVTYVDADAEEPNGHLFLKPGVTMQQRFSVRIPGVGSHPCLSHGKCQEICAFNAILAKEGGALVFKSLCHSCGACILACPEDALREYDREIGTIFVGKAGRASFLSGRLDVGEARVTPLIEELVSLVADSSELVVVDAPPGTSCSTIAAVRGADLLVLVTEPTPFGMHDLELAVEMGKALGMRIAAVVNRADLGNDSVNRFLEEESIPILAEIPFQRDVAASYAQAQLPLYSCDLFGKKMSEMSQQLLTIIGDQS